jgi:hypothetical protein
MLKPFLDVPYIPKTRFSPMEEKKMFGPWTRVFVVVIACLSIGGLLGIESSDAGTVSSTDDHVDHLITIEAVDDSMISLIDFNPDGGSFAVAQQNGVVTIYNTTTWDVEGSASTLSPLGDMEFSPDGTKLAFISERIVDYQWLCTLSVLYTSDWTVCAKKEFRGDPHFFDLEWSPDGSMLATTDPGNLMIWDTTTWNVERTFAPGHSFAVGWSPDGVKLAYGNYSWGTDNNTVDIINTTTWSKTESIDMPSSEGPFEQLFIPAYIGWSSDSTIMATTNYTAVFHTDDTDYMMDSPQRGVSDAEFRPMGRSLAAINEFSNQSGYYPLLMIVNGTNGNIVINETIGGIYDRGIYDMYFDLSWAPNGTCIAISNRYEIKIYKVHLTESVDGGEIPIPEEEDSDEDGIDDDEDAFPEDPAASADSDSDGHPDSWNTGKGASNSTTGLTIDAFPNDPEEWSDIDGDGCGDKGDAFPNDPKEWSDKDKDGYGDNGDEFPENPKEWSDDDDDGYGDKGDAFPDDPKEWNDTDDDGFGDNGDAFPTDPAASADADKDGKPEAWNPGKSEKDSTTGLVLDLAAEESTPLIKQGWFALLMIGLTILIVISITLVLILALGWRRNSSLSDEDGLIDGYRNEIISGKSAVSSRKAVSEIVSEKVGNGDISLETGTYIEGLFTEE